MAKNEENKEILTEGIEKESEDGGKKNKNKNEKKRIKVGHRYVRREVHDILQKYFDLDDENAVATLYVHYNTLSDLFEIPEDEEKSLKIKPEIVEQVNTQIDMLPNAYKIKFVIKIDDYQGYEPDEIKEVMMDNVKLLGYNVERSSRRETTFALVFLLVGIIFILISVWYANFTKNEEGLTYLIISSILEIAAWVFIWEAVDKFFLERNQIRNQAVVTGRRLYGIEFVDKEGNKYLEETAGADVIEELTGQSQSTDNL